MRTTVTLDPDVVALLHKTMRERGVTFKQAVNEAIRSGMGGRTGRTIEFPTHDMGQPIVDLTKALRIAAELEDQELAARLARGA